MSKKFNMSKLVIMGVRQFSSGCIPDKMENPDIRQDWIWHDLHRWLDKSRLFFFKAKT
jgi:hypothetical protein